MALPTAQPKPTPHLLEQRTRERDWKAIDAAESRKVKARSKGRCEVDNGSWRCNDRATEVHHHIGGWKRRGRGDSALAENKTHCCRYCHKLITGHVLQHVAGTRYRSVG